jgi:hypothetical protein
MAAAGLGIALDQDVVAAVEEDQVDVHARRGQLRQHVRHAREVDAAVAYVHAHGDAPTRPVLALADGGDQLRDQFRGHVVDAIELEVLQRPQGHGLAAAGHAGQHDEVDRVGFDDGAHDFVDHGSMSWFTMERSGASGAPGGR